MPAVLAEVIRKGPMCDEKVTLAWRLAVGPQIAKVTTVRLVPDDAPAHQDRLRGLD